MARIIVDVDDMLDSAGLVVPGHCRSTVERTISRQMNSLSEIAGNFTSVLPTDPRPRNSFQDLPNIANIRTNHWEIAGQGFFNRRWGAFSIRAENHCVGGAVVPRHFMVLDIEYRNQLHVVATLCKLIDGRLCQIVPFYNPRRIKRE